MAGGHLESMTGIGGLGSSTRDTDTFGYSLRNHQRAELPRRMKAMIQHKRRPQPYLLPLNKGLTGPFMKLKASLPPGEDSSSIGLLQGRMTQEALSLRCAQEVNSVVGALSLIQTRRQVTSEAQSSMPGMNEDVKQAATVHASENTRKRLLTRHLTQCWNKFSPHLPAREMYSLIISTGERIMSMPRMHDVAYIACFKYFLDRADSYEATLPPPATRPSTAVIDTVNPVDLKKQIGATPRTFRPRAQLGKHMADYHALRYSDPALSSRQSIVKVLDILSAILEVMKNGVLMEEPEAGAWAVWDGAGKVRTIAGSMIAAGYSEETVDPLADTISYIESCPLLLTITYLPAILDVYTALYTAHVRAEAFALAESVVQEAVAKVNEIIEDSSEKSKPEGGTESAQDSDVGNAVLQNVNLLILACEIRGIAGGRKVANADAVPPSIANAQPANLLSGKRQSANQSSAIQEEDIRASIMSHTPLRRLDRPAPMPAGTMAPTTRATKPVAPLWEVIAAGRGGAKLTASYFDLAASTMSLAPGGAGSMMGTGTALYRNSVISQGTDMTGDLLYKPSTGRGLVRTLSIKAMNQLAEKPRGVLKGERGRRVEREPSEPESPVAYGLGEGPQGEGGDTFSGFEMAQDSLKGQSKAARLAAAAAANQQQLQVAHQQTVKTARKKVTRLDDSEEGRARRQMLFDILFMLVSFHNDRDRLHAVVAALHALKESTPTLTFIEKTSGNDLALNRTDQLMLLLLDVGFDIAFSDPETFLTRTKLMSAITSDLKLGQMPRKENIARLMTVHRLQHLDLSDTMALLRQLFAYHQWERFSLLARMVDALLTSDVMDEKFNEAERNGAGKEVVVRLAAVNFWNVVLSERKVGFDAKPTGKLSSRTQTPANVVTEPPPASMEDNIDISLHMHAAAVGFLDAIADCMDDPLLPATSPRLLVDACRLMWRVLEPIFRPFTALGPVPELNSGEGRLSLDTLVVILFRSLHAVLIDVGQPKDAPFVLEVAEKLSIVLEGMHEYDLARGVLEEVIEKIQDARVGLGEGARGFSSITCQLGFHREMSEKEFNILSDFVEDTPGDNDSSSSMGNTCRDLASALVRLYRAFFRNRLKHQRAVADATHKALAMTHLRLTNKHLFPVRQRTLPAEEELRACAGNMTIKALLLMAYTREGSNLDEQEKADLLHQSAQLLRASKREERTLLRSQVPGTLLHKNQTAKNPEKLTTAYPPPLFVRRTRTTITVRIAPLSETFAGNSSGLHQEPAYYQIYCRDVTHMVPPHSVSASDGYFPGTAAPIGVDTDCTITNLNVNHAYVLAVAGYDAKGNLIRMGRPTDPIIATFPLPLVLCWGNLAQISHDANCKAVANEAFATLRSYLVVWDADDERLRRPESSEDTFSEAMFRLNEPEVISITRTAVQSFIEAVYALVERTFSTTLATVTSDSEGTRDIRSAQMLRLNTARNFHVALELARLIKDDKLMLVSSFKIFEIIIPLLRLEDVNDPEHLPLIPTGPTPLPFLVQLLLACHSTFVSCSGILGDNRGQGVRDHYCYVVFHLARRLMSRKRHFDVLKAMRVIEEAVGVLNSVPGAPDVRVWSSQHLENEWVGTNAKGRKSGGTGGPKEVGGKKKNKGGGGSDFAYHSVIAVSNEVGKGYEYMARRLETFCEYLEVELIRANNALVALHGSSGSSIMQSANQIPAPQAQMQMQPLQRVGSQPLLLDGPVVASSGNPMLIANSSILAPTALNLRKVLDQSATTLKELASVLTASGPDIALENLHRFRKNPRFVELAAFATVWCIQTGIPDHCIRICVDVEEWIEKRNLKILTYDDEEVKEGGGTIGKRKKRSLFGEKKTQDKKRTKERGRLRHASNASVAGPRPKSGAVTKSRKSKYGSVIDAVTGENATGGQHSEPKLDGSGRTDVNPISEISRRAQSDVIHPGEVPGTPPPTAFGIQLSKPTVSDSQPSPRPIHRERSQSPGSHHARSDAGGDTSTSVDAVTLRRKRAAARQAYFANLTPQDRENKERAIRVLDTVLSAFWKRRRYARRLRIVLDFEAPARARLALAHGLAVFEQLQKEVSGRDMGTSIDQTLRDQLEFRASGKIILNEFRTDPPRRVTVTTNTGSTALAVGTANADDLSPRGVTPDITRMILDMSQYMVQSITLAVRIKAWSQVLESCQHLWTAHRFLLSRNVLNGTEFRRQTLWRAWWIAATCLLDLLDGVSVRSADDEENHAHFGIPSRPSTGQTFGYPSRPATASKDAFHHQRLPLKSLSDLYTQQFIAGWLDRFGEIQVTPLDLSKIAAMCLFSLETLAAAKRNHRMIEFGMRFDRTFCGVYGQILRPVLGDAYDEYCRGTAEEGQWMTEAETWFDQGKEPRTPLQLLVRARSYHAECTLQTIRTKEPLSVPSKFLMAATGAYEAALEAAHAQKARNTAAMAAHEFGNLLFANGDREGACHLWSKCIDFVMDKTRVITDWKSVIGGDTWQFSTSASASKDVLQITGGIKNAVVAGMAIIKIVRNWYEPLHLDKHHSLVLFAAKLFSAPLKGSIPHPSRPASYGLYTPPYLSPLMDIFSDPLRCDPGTFSDALVYTASELITVIGEPWVAVPLLSLVEHLAISVYKSSSLLALARILKADGLVAMDSLADGIECLLSVSLGKALIPEDKKHYAAPAGTAVLPLADTRYDEKTHLLDSMLNLRLLRNVAEHVLSDKLGVLYGAEVAQKYELVRCKIVLRILNLSGATNADVGNVKYEQLVSRQKEDALDRNLSEKGNPLSVGLQSPHLSELPHSHNYPAAGSFAIDPNNRNASISSATGLAIAVPNHGSVSTLNKSMKRDAPGLLNAILPRLDAVLGKLISDAQIDIRNTPLSNKETWDSRVEMIVRGFDCAAQVHMLRWNYEAASKCLTSALLVLETRESSPMKPSYSIRPAIVSRFSSMPPRAYLHLQILSRLVESLLSHGLFGVAKEYAAKGISLGRANNTTKFLAYFMAMESVAVRHGRQTNAGWSDKQDEDEMPRSTNAKWLSEIDKILTVAGSKGIRTPQEWHILGDLYSVHHWPSFSSAIAAYTHACDAWKRTVPCTGRADGKSSYNGAINGFVQSSACLAWAMWDSGSHSPGAVASVLSQARNAACQIVHANPSTILQLSVLTATVTAAQRHAIDRHNAAYRSTWKAARRYFSDALHAIISDGYEHATLSSVLGGLATLYAGLTAESNSLLEPEGQAEEESKTFLHPGAGTTAALAYQATRCEGMRRALLEGTELDTSVKLKTQDVGLLAAKEIHQFLQMRTGEVDTSSLLAPEDILKPQGGFGLLSPNAQLMNLSGYKWHAQEWMDFLCSLTQDRAQRPAITTTSFSDPWQAAVAARIRRVHALLSEHVGVPYTMESCLTDSCIPKPEATADGALSLIGSPCLPDDAWSLSWTTQKPTSVHYEGCDGNTKTVERDYVYGILVQINIPRASTSTTPTTSSSRPSRPPTQSQPAGKTAKKISPRSSVASRGSSRHGNGTAASNSSLGTASSGSSIALVPASPQLMCFVFRVPLSTLKSMRDIGSKIMAILDLGDADDFEAEIEEVWSSLIGCVKACFGVNGEDELPNDPPFEELNMSLLLSLFDYTASSSSGGSTRPSTRAVASSRSNRSRPTTSFSQNPTLSSPPPLQGRSIRLASAPEARQFLTWLGSLAAVKLGLPDLNTSGDDEAEVVMEKSASGAGTARMSLQKDRQSGGR